VTREFCEAPFRAAELLSGDIHDSATLSSATTMATSSRAG
jgi:hypothetical protein